MAALDSLVEAGVGSPLAACLRRPDAVTDAVETAAIAVEALIERYPDAIAYVFACNHASEPEWQAAVAEAMGNINPRAAGVAATLFPVSSGAPLTLIDTRDPDDILTEIESGEAAKGYVAVSLQIDAPVAPAVLQDARRAIMETSHVAIVLIRPTPDVNVDSTTAAIAAVSGHSDGLLIGFSNATLESVERLGEWETVRVGTVTYLRVTTASATLTFDFVGTDMYLLGVRSPNAGIVHAWIDPPATGLSPHPDVSYDLGATQARDTAHPLFTGLSASRHTLVLVANNDDGSNVMISGFFVTGSPVLTWTGRLAAASLLLIATAALAERCASTISTIRRTSGPRAVDRWDHPRGFTRQR
ncbi:MAG TPA: hypothetical protein VMM78_05730 [Thermomicrobiales bacterium]|nr:hypothetical protein [Thermomicrobiales bacterium]